MKSVHERQAAEDIWIPQRNGMIGFYVTHKEMSEKESRLYQVPAMEYFIGEEKFSEKKNYCQKQNNK